MTCFNFSHGPSFTSKILEKDGPTSETPASAYVRSSESPVKACWPSSVEFE